MKTGDLVKLNEKHFRHPAYKCGVLYLVKDVLRSRLGGHGSCLVELYTPEGTLVAFDMSGLEIVCEAW